MKHAYEHATYDLTKATVAATSGGYDLTKAAQTPDHGRAARRVDARPARYAMLSARISNIAWRD
mgnify:CR=1 FL=1